MTLIELESGRTILIDVNIRVAADDADDPTPDVAAKLRRRLKRDAQGRLYVDVFVLSHPDQDHCSGLSRHFHLGPPDALSGDKILIRELWSSPILFRRTSSTLTLCEDAQAFNTEARRRVQRFRDVGFAVGNGDRIQLLGRDENGKTDDLTAILVEIDGLVTKVNETIDATMVARLLGPPPKSDNEDDEEALAKNRASVILRFSLMGDGVPDVCRFLTGGDAEVVVWECLWQAHSQKDWLEYDILQTPHHCSWHSLSRDSWSEIGENAQVSQDARNALSQARRGAVIVASSKPVKDDDADPPCIRAKREYVSITRAVSGDFKCTGEYPSERVPEPMEFEVGRYGPRLKSGAARDSVTVGRSAVGIQPLPHG
jgi:hypothetical protein